MRSFMVFFQKEWMELIRTKKFFILLCVFALFGMLGPVAARYMQEIISMAVGDKMPLTVPPTTWVDSWAQFYSNLSQMGGVCIIFLFMSSVCGEKQSGSAALTLTKNLTHFNFITAKLAAAVTMFLVSLVAAILVCYGYTYWLFGTAGNFLGVLEGALAYAAFNFVLIAITILASTVSQSTTVSAILAFCGFIILSLTGYAPSIGFILPGTLLSKSVELSAGATYQGLIVALIIAVGFTSLCLLLAVQSLKRQEV